MIARSRSSSAPGLLMISGGDPDLADVVQQRDELGVAALARGRRAVARRQHEVDDMAAVASRVLVVGLDDVAEEQRRPAIRLRELERVVDPHAALAREEREQPDQRHGERESIVADCREGEADRRERRVDEEDPEHHRRELAQ